MIIIDIDDFMKEYSNIKKNWDNSLTNTSFTEIKSTDNNSSTFWEEVKAYSKAFKREREKREK